MKEAGEGSSFVIYLPYGISISIFLTMCISVLRYLFIPSVAIEVTNDNATPSSQFLRQPDQAFDVLALPGANTDCKVSPNRDALQFCVVTYCYPTRGAPWSRCGLSVFNTGDDGMSWWNGICIDPSNNNKRIIGASGVYSRNVTSYSLSCADGTSQCIDQALPKTNRSCELFWPLLQKVIKDNIPSSSYLTDPSGSFLIRGAEIRDQNMWFNMCGFCSSANSVKG